MPDASAWFNRHGYSSYNVQAVCDERLLFLSVATGMPGSGHDANILRRTTFCRIAYATIPPGSYVLGDSGYPCLRWLMTPLKEMAGNRALNGQQQAYNTDQSSERMVIERAFGRLKSRWRKLEHMKMRDQTYNLNLIRSAFILHNFVEIRAHRWPDLDPDLATWPDPPTYTLPLPVHGPAAIAEAGRVRDSLVALC